MIRIIFSVLCLVPSIIGIGQNIFEQQNNVERLSHTELGIPPSPVFDLMGVTPSQVVKSSEIKDFKVDWSFKSWSLNPNISFEAQPIWELLYNRKPIKKYQSASAMMRRLTTLNVSVGTVRDEFGNRRLGFATKLGLYKEKDPLMEKNMYSDIEKDIEEERKELEKQLVMAQKKVDTLKNLLLKPQARSEILLIEQELLSLNNKRSSQISERANVLNSEFWNASWIDVGYGRVKSFQSDLSGNLDDVILNRNTAKGVWVNAGWGFGKYFLASTLIRGHLYDEEVTFTLQNNNDLSVLDTTTVASNVLMTYGVNLRYGRPLFTFFAEAIYERRGLKTPFEAVTNSYNTPVSFTILQESVEWTKLEPLILNVGGDWRIKRSIILNYSMRLAFDKEMKLSNFLPVVSLSCLMR
jgi:hypothetical protein